MFAFHLPTPASTFKLIFRCNSRSRNCFYAEIYVFAVYIVIVSSFHSVPQDNPSQFPFNGTVPSFGGPNPSFSNQNPSFGNQNPSFGGNNPSFGSNPSFSNNDPQIPPGANYPSFPNSGSYPGTYPDTFNIDNEPETFNSIGELGRLKRQVAFPEDEIAVNTTDRVEELGGELDIVAASDGRALKQIQSVTKIDVGVQSQLLVAPGSTSMIYFDVTNLRAEPTYHNFNVQDEKRFLVAMEPRFMWLQPNQKETVRVTIRVPPGTELGAKDKITFTSQGTVQAMQSAMVTVSTSGINDPWAPNIWYTYGTRCDWRTTCVGGTWSVEIVARDWESGLMSLRSNPEGLLLRAPFTAGTNDEVKATYSASCCEPRVSISVHDLNRNQRTIQLNVDEPWLSEYGVATVVLGVLFFALLIVLIVIWIVWCCKRRRASRDLPTYRPGDIRPRP